MLLLLHTPYWPLEHDVHTHEKVVLDTVMEPVVAPGVTLLPTVVVKAGIVNSLQSIIGLS